MGGSGSRLPEPSGPVSIRVVVADDHPLFRKSVVDILQKSGGIQVVGEAANGQEAVDLTCGLEPDVLVLDLAMPVMDGTEATARIRLAGVATHILILTATEDVQSLFEVFRNGAQSCLIKTVHPDELVSAIRTAASGGTVIPSHLVSAIWSDICNTQDCDGEDGLGREIPTHCTHLRHHGHSPFCLEVSPARDGRILLDDRLHSYQTDSSDLRNSRTARKP